MFFEKPIMLLLQLDQYCFACKYLLEVKDGKKYAR